MPPLSSHRFFHFLSPAVLPASRHLVLLPHTNLSHPARHRQFLPTSPPPPARCCQKKTNVAAKKVVDKTAVKQSGKATTKSGVKVPFSKPWKAPPVEKKPNSWT
jgi:hypothetical protein